MNGAVPLLPTICLHVVEKKTSGGHFMLKERINKTHTQTWHILGYNLIFNNVSHKISNLEIQCQQSNLFKWDYKT